MLSFVLLTIAPH